MACYCSRISLQQFLRDLVKTLVKSMTVKDGCVISRVLFYYIVVDDVCHYKQKEPESGPLSSTISDLKTVRICCLSWSGCYLGYKTVTA